MKHSLRKLYLACVVSMCTCSLCANTTSASQSWRREEYRTSLANKYMEAEFQAGFLYKLTDITKGNLLVSNSPEGLAAALPVFGEYEVDLDQCTVAQELSKNAIVTTVIAQDGTALKLRWSLENSGDLILNMSADTAKPVDQFRMIIAGCDISRHTLVTIGNYGVGHPYKGPWQGSFGNIYKTSCSQSFVQPLVALFEGNDPGGWFIEGRDPKVGPANLGAQGRGNTAELIFVRGFPLTSTANPRMYEIRIRISQEHWADAVDPYIEWMGEDAGFVPLDQDGHHPPWVKDIELQSYVRVGDFTMLDALAKRVDPRKVLIGREVGYRKYRMDYNYPNYEYSEHAKKWIRHARELGFHVGAHFNSALVCEVQPDLVERFREGFLVTGVDENGYDIYQGIGSPPTRHYACSLAMKDWREYLTAQMKEAVDAGIDVVYLDGTMSPNGKYVVDDMTGVQGLFAIMELIKETYPGVAIETEQFNNYTAYQSDFALSQMPLGHPLSGYIFSRFIKIVPESVMTAPSDKEYIEAFAHWAHMTPSVQIGRRESWFEIDDAYITYGLTPDPRMPYDRPVSYQNHYTPGVIPIYDDSEKLRYSGLKGKDGVTAYFEKAGNKRGMVLYVPGKDPRWLGARINGISQWTGAGAIRDWLIYNEDRIMGLEPQRSYCFDESVKLPQDRFHVTGIPDDFVLHYIGYLDDAKASYEGQEIGNDDAYFKLRFNGNGRLRLYVPDEYLLFINGQPIAVDPKTSTASAIISTSEVSRERKSALKSEWGDGVGQRVTAAAFREVNERLEEVSYSMLLALRKDDTPLDGLWTELDWQIPPKQRTFHLVQHHLHEVTADGPALMLRKGTGFYSHVTGRGIIIGRFPEADVIRVEGAYRLRNDSNSGSVRAKLWINGKQVLTLPGSEKRPFEIQPFDVDISEFAGKYAMLEFGIEGEIRANVADWISPQFIVVGKK